METSFIYDRPVTGKNFIGRKNECNALANMLDRRENIAIYEPPKSGKRSLIQQALFSMRSRGKRFGTVNLDLFNIRSLYTFLTRFGSAVLRAYFSSPAEYSEIMERHLSATCFVFDRERFSSYDEVVSIIGEPDEKDIRKMMELPGKIAEEKEEDCIVILEEFQNIMEDKEEYETLFKAMEEIFSETAGADRPGCSFILAGSRVNAMKYIFEERRFFYRTVEHIPLPAIDGKEIAEYARRGFLSGGKVIEKEQAAGACRLFRNNIWYMNHFCSICNSLSPGYINDGVMMDALNSLLSIHSPRFESMMFSLTGYQISFLKAVLDGVVKFSAAEIVEKYSLNSSANIKRVKEALMKKEIITFNEKEEPVILDPLFEYWAGKFYFGMNI